MNAGLSVGGALALYKLYCGRYVSEGNHEKNVEQLVEKLVEGLKQLANAQSELCHMAVASPAASTQGSALLQTTVRTKSSAAIATISGRRSATKKLTSETC